MKYTIYGKTGCSACIQAKQLLESKQAEYEYVLLGLNYSLDEFYSIAPKTHRAFPMITVVEKYDGVEMHEQYVGGLYQLQQILNSDSK